MIKKRVILTINNFFQKNGKNLSKTFDKSKLLL